MRNSYLLLFTEISDRGGIEVFSRYFLDAISQSVNNTDIRVLLLDNDSPPNIDTINHGTNRLEYFCCNSKIPLFKKIKFMALFFWSVIFKRPKLIISNYINLLKPCVIIYPFLKIDYVVVAYGVDVWNLEGFLEKMVLKNAKRVASFSKFTTLKINEQIKLKGKIFPLPPPISANSFSPQPKNVHLMEKYTLKESKVILTVARLKTSEARKGYNSVIKVLPKVIKEIPNAKYLLVGSGNDIPRLKALVTALCLEDYVVFCGFVPNEKLIDYYNLCDVFIMPSEKEGFGIVFLEALACGKPVIAGNKDGAVDALLNGKLGVLVDPNNEEEIARAIIKVLRGEVDKSVLDGEYLREKVLEAYGLDKFKERVKTLIEVTL